MPHSHERARSQESHILKRHFPPCPLFPLHGGGRCYEMCACCGSWGRKFEKVVWMKTWGESLKLWCEWIIWERDFQKNAGQCHGRIGEVEKDAKQSCFMGWEKTQHPTIMEWGGKSCAETWNGCGKISFWDGKVFDGDGETRILAKCVKFELAELHGELGNFGE